MANKNMKQIARRRKRVRSKIVRQSEYPRMSVHRTNNHIYVQVIDDYKAMTLASSNDGDFKGKKMTRVEKATEIGKDIASKLKEKKIKQVVFDRGSFAYAGRVKAIAEAVREAGITI